MKALFVYSGFIYRCNGRFYTLNLTPSALYNLYFPYCNELTICERIRDISDPKGLTEISEENIHISCPDFSPSSISLYLTNTHNYYSYLKAIVKDYDFIIVRQGLLGNYAARLARKNNIPYIYESVGHTFDSFWNHGILGKIIAIPLTLAVKKNIQKSKYVTYVTEKYLQHIYPTSGKSIGISDVEIIDTSDSIIENRIKKIEGLKPDNRLKLVTVGGIAIPVKGQRYAIKAIAELKKMGIIMDYYLIGSGSSLGLKDYATSLGVENQVHFLGSIAHDKVFDVLDTMDIYIQPSLQEGLPRAVVEAMSRGLLCLGSNIAGIPELLPKEMLFEKKNVNQIINILLKIDQKTLKAHAVRNFSRSKDFLASSLKQKRDKFYDMFLKDNF